MKDEIGNAVPVLRSGVVSSMIEGSGIFFCHNETNDSIIVFLLTRIKEISFNGKKLFV